MREFFRFYGRVLRVAYGGARGQARAAGFYIALVAGAARIFGYDVVLTISTATVTTIAFAGSLAVMLV